MWNRYWLVVPALALLGLGAALQGRIAAPAAEAAGPVWEYRQVPFHGDYRALDTILADAGAEGFELVLISPQDTVAIFKRPGGS